MDATVISILHQLASNPHIVNQLQQFLSIIKRDEDTSHNQNIFPGRDVASHGQALTKSLCNVTNTHTSSAFLCSSLQDEMKSDVAASSPISTFAQQSQAATVFANTGKKEQNRVQHDEKLSTRVVTKSMMLPQLALKNGDDEFKEQDKTATTSKQRVKELETQLHPLTLRIDELFETVQSQRKELHRIKEQHQLEIDELKNIYEAILRRRDEVHQESLRQAIKSRDLYVSAKALEQTVKVEDPVDSETHARMRHVNGCISNSLTSNSSTRLGVKRERAEQTEGVNINSNSVRKSALGNVLPSLHNDHRQHVTLHPFPSETNPEDVTGSNQNNKLHPGQPSRQRKSVGPPVSGTRMYLDGRLPILNHGKTNLISGVKGNSKCQTSTISIRPTSHKRHTPRTPSLTHADRLHHKSPSNNNGIAYYSASPVPQDVACAAVSKMLPGTISVKLASPTPIPTTGLRPLFTKAARRLPTTAARSVASPTVRCETSPVGSGPTRSPSPINPKRGETLPRRFIFTGLKDSEPDRLREAVVHLGQNAAVLNGDFDEVPPLSTTHVVLRGTPRSVKALCGVVSGKWLVPPEYIYNSREAGFWLDEQEEGGLRIFPPPLSCQRFLITVEHEEIREKLAQVIKYGGGEVILAPVYRPPSGAVSKQCIEKGVVVITSGDDLLRHATQLQV